MRVGTRDEASIQRARGDGEVKDLSGESPEVEGLTARVEALLPARGGHPQYMVVVFGVGTVRGELFEVDERELGHRTTSIAGAEK